MKQTRKGNWIQTWSGIQFWPLDPRPEDIQILDIAHALGKLCRYNGHTQKFYSVAEHSVYVSRRVPKEFTMWGLLHDAAEAYISDIPGPIKKMLPDVKIMEGKIMAAIVEKFGLIPSTEPPEVKQIDNDILNDEAMQLMGRPFPKWEMLNGNQLGIHIAGWLPGQAITNFIGRFHEL